MTSICVVLCTLEKMLRRIRFDTSKCVSIARGRYEGWCQFPSNGAWLREWTKILYSSLRATLFEYVVSRALTLNLHHWTFILQAFLAGGTCVTITFLQLRCLLNIAIQWYAMTVKTLDDCQRNLYPNFFFVTLFTFITFRFRWHVCSTY